MKNLIVIFFLFPLCSFGQILNGEYLSTLMIQSTIIEDEDKVGNNIIVESIASDVINGSYNMVKHTLISFKFNKNTVEIRDLVLDKFITTKYTQTGNQISLIDNFEGNYHLQDSDEFITLVQKVDDSTSIIIYLVKLPSKHSLMKREALIEGTLKVNDEKTRINNTELGLDFGTSQALGKWEYESNRVTYSGLEIYYLKNVYQNPVPVFIVNKSTENRMSGTLIVYDNRKEPSKRLMKYKFQIK
ncbi:hypothetical protein [Flammeovirga agarivorans]|uniref:Uncharacterized protein n=1 Tax=Flammeovirga agarivorans TaxID=2726742 RepID=A0A7X8XZC2_9BACT|nr:hypothetical protein [Flammeovirga agarivorans]NLR95044.1 hypothetical protein [Flammeovirga agarivorans]